VKGEYKDTEG